MGIPEFLLNTQYLMGSKDKGHRVVTDDTLYLEGSLGRIEGDIYGAKRRVRGVSWPLAESVPGCWRDGVQPSCVVLRQLFFAFFSLVGVS